MVILTLTALLAAVMPDGVALADESPVAIVVPPPRFISGGSEDATAAAELACYRLARELEKNASLRVVDRAHLDRVLKERGLDDQSPRPILSYDILARLEVDAVRPAPKAYLKLVDLSHGNVLAEVEFAWSVPMPDAAVRDMAKTCLSAARDLTAVKPKALRVRMLEVQNPGKSARLEPLAARLSYTFAAALGRSEGVRLVHHLEAATAKEESLLLTLGLSRLGGGRQFAPQSDATVELRIRELDGVGKTFEQTKVEVAWRVRRGTDHSGDWATAEAQVKNFDSLLKTAWTRCAESLGQASPQAAGDYLDELALRRKQAQAELDAAPKGIDTGRHTRGLWRQRLAHVATAAKLDPTWEEPAFLLIRATAEAQRDDVKYDFDAWDSAIREAMNYLRRFRDDSKRRREAMDTGMFYAFNRFVELRSGEPLARLSKRDLDTLDVLKQMVEMSVTGPVSEVGDCGPLTARLVYRGMTAAGVPQAQRREWLQATIRNVDAQAVRSASEDGSQRTLLQYCRMWYRAEAVGLMVDEDDAVATERYVDELTPLLAAVKGQEGTIVEDVRRHLGRMSDHQLLSRFREATAPTSPVSPIQVRWPHFNPWPDALASKEPKVIVRTFRVDRYTDASPLMAIGGRMYLLVPGTDWSRLAGASRGGMAEHIGTVALDGQQRPTGQIILLPAQPTTRRPLQVLSAAVSGGRLYLGTLESGLLEYDPKKEAWRVFGPDEGMPDWTVRSVLSVGDGRLFCAGGDGQNTAFFCGVGVAPSKSEIVPVRRTSPDNANYPLLARIGPAWAADGKLAGFVESGKFLPDAAATSPDLRPWPSQTPFGWKRTSWNSDNTPSSMAVIASRRFIMGPDALREVNDEGRTLQTWWLAYWLQVTSGQKGLPGLDVRIPSDLPAKSDMRTYTHIVQDDAHIFLVGPRIICFDPMNEVWYGPMERQPFGGEVYHAASGTKGIWLRSGGDLIYLDTADLIAAARAAGRVITGDEFRRKRQEAIDASPPLERAKWVLSMRQFDKARELCAAVLDDVAGVEGRNVTADAVEALLVMALLHESCCLNQRDKAMEYYGKLAAIVDNPSAAFTGLVHQYRLHIEAKQYADALRVGKLIAQRYPRNSVSEAIARYNRWLEEQVTKSEGGGK